MDVLIDACPWCMHDVQLPQQNLSVARIRALLPHPPAAMHMINVG
jgi:hypothetical protein